MRKALRWSLVATALWAAPAEADWGPVAAVDRSRGSLDEPQLTVGPSGTIAAAWVEWEDNQERVRYASRPPGGEWSFPRELSGPEPGIEQLAFALDAHDNPVVAWVARDAGGRSRLKATTHTHFSPFYPPETLAEDAHSPSVVFDDDGTPTVLFGAGVHGARRIGAVSRSGGEWSAVDDLPASVAAHTPTVVNRPGAGLTALWLEGTALRSSDLGAGWSAPVTIDATGGVPDLQVNVSGELVAAWRGPGGIEAASRSAGAGWGTPVAIAAASQAEHVRVALNASGDTAAVWTADDRVYASSRTLPGAWSTPVALTATANALAPRVVLDPAGVATAVWESGDGSGARRATRAANGAWAAPVSLSSAGDGNHGTTAALTLDAAGDATAAWISAEFAAEGARSRLLSSTTGPSVITETKILSGPADGSYTRHDRATFTFNAGVDWHHCSDSLGATMCHSPYEMWLPEEGPHRFAVAVGTDATAATRTVHLDTTPPSIGVTLAGASPTADRFPLGAKVDVSLHVTDGGSGVHSHTTPGSLFTAAPGTHVYTATARDNVGNVGKATFDYIVDAPPAAATPVPTPEPTPAPAAPEPEIIPPRLLAGARPTIAALLRRGVSARYRATTAGRLTVEWRSGRSLLARGVSTITRPGTVTLRIRPTAGGRRVLRKRKSMRVTAKTTFRTAAATDVSTAMLTLKRGRTT